MSHDLQNKNELQFADYYLCWRKVLNQGCPHFQNIDSEENRRLVEEAMNNIGKS